MTSFDRRYFDKWYRSPRHRVHAQAAIRRQAALAVAAAEYLLERPIRRVLDVGAGEGAWCREITRMRPRVRYTGIEPSEYAVARYGARRNIRHGSFGTLGDVADLEKYDLVVCVDVLHYVPKREIAPGAAALGERLHGVALLHAFTRTDEIEGDPSGYMSRSASLYRAPFTRAGLTEIGLGLWVGEQLEDRLAALERQGG